MCATCSPPTAASTKEEVRAWTALLNARRPNPDPVCTKCLFPYAAEDGGTVRQDLCSSCETRWLDRIIRDLVWRKGHRKAIKILKRLPK